MLNIYQSRKLFSCHFIAGKEMPADYFPNLFTKGIKPKILGKSPLNEGFTGSKGLWKEFIPVVNRLLTDCECFNCPQHSPGFKYWIDTLFFEKHSSVDIYQN